VTPAHARERVASDDGEEYSRGYVQQRLSRLEEHGHATNLGGGLYELVDPRDDVGQEDAVAELKEHVCAPLAKRSTTKTPTRSGVTSVPPVRYFDDERD